jgi:hypothetical protein
MGAERRLSLSPAPFGEFKTEVPMENRNWCYSSHTWSQLSLLKVVNSLFVCYETVLIISFKINVQEGS